MSSTLYHASACCLPIWTSLYRRVPANCSNHTPADDETTMDAWNHLARPLSEASQSHARRSSEEIRPYRRLLKRDKPDTASIAQTCIPQLSVATLILCLTFRHRPSSLGTITLLARNIHATLGAHISSLVSWRTIRDLVHPEQTLPLHTHSQTPCWWPSPWLVFCVPSS